MSNTVQVVINITDKGSGKVLGGITGALGNMASVAGGIIAADLFGKISDGFVSAATTGFDFNRSIENATARLNAFTKDSAVSTQILSDLRLEAAKTPFAFEDMANAGTSLLPVANQLNMDLMDLVRTAEILAASNPAEGLEGAAFALKEAASGDFTSIIERFNLSRSAINALKEEGVPNMEIIARVMKDMGLDMDLVSNLSTTFDGRMSTLMDTFTTLAGAFTQPIFAVLSAGLGEAQTSLDAMMPALEETARSWGQTAADSIQTFKEAWNGEWEDDEIIQPVHRFVGKATLAVKDLWDKASALGDEYGPKITRVFEDIGTAVTEMDPIWGAFNNVVGSTNRLFSEIWRLGGEVAEQFGFVDEKATDATGAFKDTLSTSEALTGYLDLLALAIDRIASAAARAADEWARLNGQMGVKQTGGGPPGPGDTPDTAPGATAGQGNVIVPIPPPDVPGPGDVPDTGPGGAISPIPPPNKRAQPAGSVAAPQTTTKTAVADGIVIYMTVNVYTPMDVEEIAYKVAAEIQQRRSES